MLARRTDTMTRTVRRVVLMASLVPITVLVFGLIYMVLMEVLEGEHRSYLRAVEWAAETITSTGYGADSQWNHPLMVAFVILTQFVGQAFILAMLPLIVAPMIEDRFEVKLPREIPKLRDFVLIYRHGPATEGLLSALDAANVPIVVLEEDEAVARRLHDRGRNVVFVRFDEVEPDLSQLRYARSVVANGSDQENAAMILSTRDQGYAGPIFAFVEHASHSRPMVLAGATFAYTPKQVLAAALAARASHRLSPRVIGIGDLTAYLEFTEVRIHSDSVFAGQTLREANIRHLTGATVVGIWGQTGLDFEPTGHTKLEVGAILLALGHRTATAKLEALAVPLRKDGALLIIGYGEVGRKIADCLREVGESFRVIERKDLEGVDVVGDALDPRVLRKAGIEHARAVILALDSGSPTALAAALVRDLAPHTPIIARVNRNQDLIRAHRAGADFALSFSRVASQLLLKQLLGEESISIDPHVRLVGRKPPAEFVGKALRKMRLRERTQCSVVAIRRGTQVLVELDAEMEVLADDVLYICGSVPSLRRYHELFD